MEVGKLSAEYRTTTGKSNVRRLRAAGKIPAIVYGGGTDPVTIAVDPTALLRALDPVKKTNTVIQLTVAGGPKGNEQLTVMVRDHQKDALRGNVTHADFIRVQLDKDVHAVVPIILTGKAEGVKLGGIMHQVIHRLEIACTPDKIPIKIEIDVSALNMNEALHVSDIKLGPGIKARTHAGQTVCAVTVPKAEKVETPVAEAVPAEGAAAAGAAPAAGGKEGDKAAAPAAAGAKGAAPAKEGGDKKKKE